MVVKAEKLTVTGRVQRVGYRRYILDLAQEKGLAGYVRNEKDGSVTIFVQGEEKILSDFLAKVHNPPPPAFVKDVRKLSSKPYPGLKHFGIKFGSVSEELQEGFGAMQTEFRDYRNEFRDYRNEFRDYRNEFRDYREEFRGFAERTDNNFKELGNRYGEISEKLSTILDTLQRESAETRKEMTRAVDNLARLVDQYIKSQGGKA
jgi:acylphosphatase